MKIVNNSKEVRYTLIGEKENGYQFVVGEQSKSAMKNNGVVLHTEAALKERVALHNWLKRENKLFSNMVEQTVTNANVLRFYNAGIAFCVMALTANYNMITALIGLAWFGTAVIDLNNNLKKK